MALTRKMLKGMSLTEEQIDTIIDAHTETVDALKEERDNYKEDAKKSIKLQKELDDLKKNNDGNDSYKEKYEALKKEYSDYKNDQTAKETKAKKAEAYKALLEEIGCSHVDRIVKYSDIDSLELDDDGKLKNADKVKEEVKKEWGDHITKNSEQGANTSTPPANTGVKKMTKEEIYKKDDKGRYVLDTTSRQKALAELRNSEE